MLCGLWGCAVAGVVFVDVGVREVLAKQEFLEEGGHDGGGLGAGLGCVGDSRSMLMNTV